MKKLTINILKVVFALAIVPAINSCGKLEDFGNTNVNKFVIVKYSSSIKYSN